MRSCRMGGKTTHTSTTTTLDDVEGESDRFLVLQHLSVAHRARLFDPVMLHLDRFRWQGRHTTSMPW